MKINIKYISLLFLAGFASLAQALELNVAPGGLKNALDGIGSEKNLKISGVIDARDFQALKNIPGEVVSLDLSALTVKETSLGVAFEEEKSTYAYGELPSYLFFQSRLQEIILPDCVTFVPEGCFASSSVRKVSVGKECKTAGRYSFSDCSYLSEVSLPSGLKSIEEGAFRNCKSLSQLAIPSGVALEGAEIFKGSGIESLDLSGVVKMADFSVANANYLSSVKANPVAETGEGVFMSDHLLSELDGSPSDIPALYAADARNLKPNEIIGNSSSIGEYAFANLKITNITLYPGVESIAKGAFADCRFLQSIDANAAGSYIPVVSENAFDGIEPSNIDLYVTALSFDAWKNHPVWGEFNVIAGESGVDSPEETFNTLVIDVTKDGIAISGSSDVIAYIVAGIDGIILSSGNVYGGKGLVVMPDRKGSPVIIKASDGKSEKELTVLLP